MSNTLKEIGIIIGEANSSEFYFASKPGEMPSRWEYLVAYSEEDVNGIPTKVEVIAQIERIISASQVLTRDLDFEIIQKIIDAGLADKQVWGEARIIGYLDANHNLCRPKKAVMPGKPVFIAPSEFLEKFYSYPKEEAIELGYLITRRDVPINLSIKGFRRHLAVIAQTGSGKTYLSGVLAEELLKKGGTILMIDPHADYVFLSRTAEGKRHDLSDRITVFRNPSSTGRYTEKEVGKIESYEICFSDLDIDEICLISGISTKYVNIVEGLQEALNRTKLAKDVFKPEDLMEIIESANNWVNDGVDKKTIKGALAAKKYLARLIKMRVFTHASTNIREMLKPMHLSDLDLSGLNDRVSDYITFTVLSDIYQKAVSRQFEFPVFIFVEEAHKFIPNEGSTYSASIIKKIAAEGRKFGVFLIVITQRPSKIHSDALSQCNSQIIMRLTNPNDQRAVSNSSERLGETLMEDLPGLNTGEAIVVGEMTRAPLMISVRKRSTKEGGSDIDIIAKMKKALEIASKETTENQSQLLRDDLNNFMT